MSAVCEADPKLVREFANLVTQTPRGPEVDSGQARKKLSETQQRLLILCAVCEPPRPSDGLITESITPPWGATAPKPALRALQKRGLITYEDPKSEIHNHPYHVILLAQATELGSQIARALLEGTTAHRYVAALQGEFTQQQQKREQSAAAKWGAERSEILALLGQLKGLGVEVPELEKRLRSNRALGSEKVSTEELTTLLEAALGK